MQWTIPGPMAAGAKATMEISFSVDACENLDNKTTATWGCAAGDCLVPDKEAEASVQLVLKKPNDQLFTSPLFPSPTVPPVPPPRYPFQIRVTGSPMT